MPKSPNTESYKDIVRKIVGRPKKLKLSDIPNLRILIRNLSKKIDADLWADLIGNLRILPLTYEIRLEDSKTKQVDLKLKDIHPKKRYLEELFTLLSEIAYSLEVLYRVPIYLTYFPKNGKRIDKNVYFCYHWENYLNEVYKLRHRILRLLGFLRDEFRKENQHKQFSCVKKMKNQVEQSFSRLTQSRRAIIHIIRTEEKLFRLMQVSASFQLISEFSKSKKEKKYWNDLAQRLSTLPNISIHFLNKGVLTLVNAIFGQLNVILAYRTIKSESRAGIRIPAQTRSKSKM